MSYTSKYNKFILLVFFSSIIISYSPTSPFFLRIIQTVFLVFIFLLFTIRYTINFKKDGILYEVRLLFFTFQKIIIVEDILHITLSVYGFTLKGAVIKTNSKLLKNIRLINFMPHAFFDELIAFANRHKIPLIKTKKYLQLFNK